MGSAEAKIRDAVVQDAAAIAAIYEPIVVSTPISFEFEAPDAAEMQRRILDAQREHAWIVAEDHGRVIGYAYAGPFRSRAAYSRSCEVSVYLADDARGGGLGRRLLSELLDRVQEAGFTVVIAGVTLPNPASVALFERAGFVPVGTFHKVGSKFDRWHDVGFWQRELP